jgi:hypothetical protein
MMAIEDDDARSKFIPFATRQSDLRDHSSFEFVHSIVQLVNMHRPGVVMSARDVETVRTPPQASGFFDMTPY